MTGQKWGWVAVTVGILTIGGKVVTTSAFVQDVATRVKSLEWGRVEDKKDVKEDLDYIRGRVDDIYNRLPPCGQCEVR